MLRAQLVFTGAGPGLTPAQGVEPGPASHDQPRRTGEPHLASYITMGLRGAVNAVSYFKARAADPNVGWHGGCGPIAISLQRNGYVALVYFAVKPGSALQPANPWAVSNVNATTNWGLWWFNWGDIRSTLVSGLIVGPYVQIVSSTPLNYPIRAGHAWEQDCAGPDIYTEDGQLGLPITPEMLLSG